MSNKPEDNRHTSPAPKAPEPAPKAPEPAKTPDPGYVAGQPVTEEEKAKAEAAKKAKP